MFLFSTFTTTSVQNRQKIYLFKSQSERIKYLKSLGIKIDSYSGDDLVLLNSNDFLDEDALSSSYIDFIQASFAKIKQIESELISE